MKSFARVMAHVLFWSWNTIFLAFVALGFVPVAGIQLIDALVAGLIPWEFLIFGLALVSIPVFSLLVGALFLRHWPAKLFALGYGVEAPLLIAVIVRFFGIRELMPGVTFLLVMAVIGLLTLLWQLLDAKIDGRNGLLTCIRVAGLTILLLVGVYTSLWVAFYVPPVAVTLLQAIGHALIDLPSSIGRGYGPSLAMLPFMLLGFLLMVYSGSLFVVLPIAAPIIYVRQWWQSLRTMWRRANRGVNQPLAIALPTITATACIAGFVWTNQQPQRKAFALLDTAPTSPQQAEALLQEKDSIRAGLLNAYLASYRYTSAVGDVRHISDMYQYTLGLRPTQAQVIQSWYEFVTRPFLYEPVTPLDGMASGRNLDRIPQQTSSFRADAQRAAKLYQRVFDQPINKAERNTIVQAVRSTWSRDMATNAWQAVDDREILLVRQELSVVEHGDWADMELYEAYRNQTAQRQEVVYYFSLPESAVITGLWLGDSPNRNTRYAYTVAPRGAAQAMYRNEVRRNVDPALVEQIGPRQYRLRVFPIEPPRWRWDASQGRTHVEEAPQMHLWLTWRAMASNKTWPLLQLSEKRNVYWDRSSVRIINRQIIPPDSEPWLPEAVPAISASPPVAHRVDFDNGTSVIAEPIPEQAVQPDTFQGKHLAVIVDRSYSMAIHAGEVSDALARLRDLKTAAPTDVYLTAPEFHGDKPGLVDLPTLKPEQLSYYGGQNPADLLHQFGTLRQGRQYDAILVLTDNSGYELGPDSTKFAAPDAPLWMIHFGGAVPLGYDDNTLQVIQASGGGVAATLQEALVRLAASMAQQDRHASSHADVVDGYIWRVIPTSATSALQAHNAQSHVLMDPFAGRDTTPA
jgi:putative PEP-CTERM system integral membrane protein